MSVTDHYPNAVTLSSLEKKILSELNSHSMDPSETIWGTSICSDEVNNTFNAFSHNFVGPGPFRFGGISGLPFTGKTGFRAFASHIPDNGGACILYGPHIGVSGDGKAGEIMREGHQNHSTCCGSLIAGLESVKLGSVPQTPARDDYQQSQVSQMLIEKHTEITQSSEPIKTVTEIAYRQIDREMKDILSACDDAIKHAKVLLIGGIVINTDWDQEDLFEIRDISLIS